MSEPCDLSAVTARRLIGARKLSPVELLESCLARIEAVNPAVNAMVAMDTDRAREAAKQAEASVMSGEKLGLLHGLPIGIKDLEETKGLRTTWGSPIFADHIPTRDEAMVGNLRAAGAIVTGKTNTPEFGAGANTRNLVYGATGNAFDPTRSAASIALVSSCTCCCDGDDWRNTARAPARTVIGDTLAYMREPRPGPGIGRELTVRRQLACARRRSSASTPTAPSSKATGTSRPRCSSTPNCTARGPTRL